ncbi:hypothetical protein [Amycolatopsis balhimycina]|uniref:hypothetical protein n=1 Tax=Amycolatopsis balhimycina TaxID=208443 RepID=UPI000F776E04|nr:hypothetical protein [Amycolatopsis balhimycina]
MESVPQEISRVVRTSAGLCAVWQPEAFKSMEDDFELWEDWATENHEIEKSISRGIFVPLNVGGDGVFQVTVRVGSPELDLTESERRYRLVESEPYLFTSLGSFAVGGIEDICDVDRVAENRFPLAEGRYSVVVNLIDWKADPNSIGSDGRPLPSALPDFLVLVRPEVSSAGNFRTKVETFVRN